MELSGVITRLALAGVLGSATHCLHYRRASARQLRRSAWIHSVLGRAFLDRGVRGHDLLSLLFLRLTLTLDVILETVNGRLPVIFGCSGNSVPQVLAYARAAGRAGADAVIAMAPARADVAMTMTMFRRLADAYDGPIVLQNAAQYAPLSSEQVATLVDEIPSIQYIKEERPPGPKHIAQVHALVGDKVKTIFGGYGGRFLPEELSRGANGCMPACELADVLATVQELWWAGDEAGARNLHNRLLPLLIRETWPFMRYMLKRRGVFTSLVERAPAGAEALDPGDEAEIDALLEAVTRDITAYPFLPR